MTVTSFHPPLARARLALALLTLLVLAGCGGGRGATTTPGSMSVPRYTGDESFVWCVPYARAISGVRIQGDADTWWTQAEGRYARDNTPRLGAVLTLRPDSRLRSGHVAVVTGIEGPRVIRVSHANWGWDDKTRGRIYENMPAQDVSQANDWSQVRFMHPEVNGYGRVYSALGFIHSDTRIASITPDHQEEARSLPETGAIRTTPRTAAAPYSRPTEGQKQITAVRSLQLW
ncbi:MAG: CHAP domain-containing protein [Rhodospirillum sp.]|nr:CHAP domain-containing protein [Rhodospirillum sp.]MCF8488058.1 CHAP domain-containing protein [Rhodospirillum sp.]MCF8501542.1 CHAP domain-containing protein [Rhodospirillum sp.]